MMGSRKRRRKPSKTESTGGLAAADCLLADTVRMLADLARDLPQAVLADMQSQGASVTSGVARSSRMDQAATRRGQTSITTARYKSHAVVGMWVMSTTQVWSGVPDPEPFVRSPESSRT